MKLKILTTFILILFCSCRNEAETLEREFLETTQQQILSCITALMQMVKKQIVLNSMR